MRPSAKQSAPTASGLSGVTEYPGDRTAGEGQLFFPSPGAVAWRESCPPDPQVGRRGDRGDASSLSTQLRHSAPLSLPPLFPSPSSSRATLRSCSERVPFPFPVCGVRATADAQTCLVALGAVSQILNSKPYDPFADVEEDNPVATTDDADATKKNKEGERGVCACAEGQGSRRAGTRTAHSLTRSPPQRTRSTSASNSATDARRSRPSRASPPSTTARSS